ncbi:MAG: cytochrome c oxidase subunit II [bacterium]
MAVTIFLSGLLTGCFGGGKQSTIRPESDSAQVIQDVYALVTWIDVGILVLVVGLFFYGIIRFRAKKGQKDRIPEQIHGNPMLEVMWTLIPAILLIFIAVPTWEGIFRANQPPSENALKVKAIGHQWWWEFQYPELGTVTANELYLPVGKSVIVETTSVDVIHAFWLPRLVGKIDSMPDRSNFLWFTPQNIGTYYGQCAEFCGTSHANMRFRVHVVSQVDFEEWLALQKESPAAVSADAKAGKTLFAQKMCFRCHIPLGIPFPQTRYAPNLTNLPARQTLGAGMIDLNKANLVRWILDPQKVKPGALMGLGYPFGSRVFKPFDLNEKEAGQIAAYLLSPAGRAPPPPPPPVSAQPKAEAPAAKPEPKAEAPAAKPEPPVESPVAALSGKALITMKGCAGCHIVPGVPGAISKVGPDLNKFASRPKIAGVVDNTPENLAKWLDNPPAVKKGTLMPPLGLSKPEIDALIKFLSTLK